VITVLEPYRDTPRVIAVDSSGAGNVAATLASGKTVELSLDDLIKRHAVH
jgi:hypothetical protein